MHVDDVADVFVCLMDKYNYDEIWEFVNIGVGKYLSIRELAEMIRDITG